MCVPYMRAQVRGYFCMVIAYMADIFRNLFISSVMHLPNMQSQVGFLVGSIVAQFTSKGFVACMNPHMPSIRGLLNNFQADCTLTIARWY